MSAAGKPIIVLSRQLPDAFVAALESFASLRVIDDQAPGAVLEGASVYLAAGVDPVPSSLIEQMPPGLGLIANIATGTDNIDLAAATSRGIAVTEAWQIIPEVCKMKTTSPSTTQADRRETLSSTARLCHQTVWTVDSEPRLGRSL